MGTLWVHSGGIIIEKIIIYSSRGNTVETIYDNFDTTNRLYLNVQPGIYFIEVISLKQSYMKKVIIE